MSSLDLELTQVIDTVATCDDVGEPLIVWLVALAGRMQTLPEMSDVDTAVMALRHYILWHDPADRREAQRALDHCRRLLEVAG